MTAFERKNHALTMLPVFPPTRGIYEEFEILLIVSSLIHTDCILYVVGKTCSNNLRSLLTLSKFKCIFQLGLTILAVKRYDSMATSELGTRISDTGARKFFWRKY